MKKVCIVTAARSEYGLLRWTIDAVHHDLDLELQLVVTGSHLQEEHGYTYKEIESDGYPIAAKADMHLKTDSTYAVAQSMGYCALSISETFERLRPDIVIVLGDRYELLPICSAALVMNIPIAHISGGDVTEGAIDNEVRNAVSMMSSLHLPGVSASADNLKRMLNRTDGIYTVGEPGLENFRRLALWTRSQLSADIKIPKNNKWVLVTVHPETQCSLAYNQVMARNVIEVLIGQEDVSIVISKANADYGGVQINDYFQAISNKYPEKVKLYPSLGQVRYLSFMKECYAVIGNSSSGIVEAPCLGKPVINIGDRQKGRHLCDNVLQVENTVEAIQGAWNRIISHTSYEPDYYYGDGNTSSKILDTIKSYLYDK